MKISVLWAKGQTGGPWCSACNHGRNFGLVAKEKKRVIFQRLGTVSYTHLTLPTNREV